MRKSVRRVVTAIAGTTLIVLTASVASWAAAPEVRPPELGGERAQCSWATASGRAGPPPNEDLARVDAPDIVSFELAGSREAAVRMFDCLAEAATDGGVLPQDRLLEGLDRDTWFIVLYTLTCVFWCLNGAAHTPRRNAQVLGRVLAAAAVIAGALDLFVENPAVRDIFDEHADRAVTATTAATVKFGLLVFVVPYVVWAVAFGAARAFTVVGGGWARPMFLQTAEQPYEPPGQPVVPPVPRDEPPGDGWMLEGVTAAHRYAIPGVMAVRGRLGLGFSGGGIRSASFNLGTSQVLDERGVTASAEFLATVSGGGYLGGARQMVGHDLRARGLPHAPPTPLVLAVDAPETAFLRGHRKYLWSSSATAALAVTRFLLGIATNIAVLVTAIYLLATPVGWAARIGWWWPYDSPTTAGYVRGSVALVALLVVGCVVLALRDRTPPADRRAGLGRWLRFLTPAVAVAALLVLLPHRAMFRSGWWVVGAIALGLLSVALPTLIAAAVRRFGLEEARVRRLSLDRLAGPLLGLVALVLFLYWVGRSSRANPTLDIGPPVWLGLTVALSVLALLAVASWRWRRPKVWLFLALTAAGCLAVIVVVTAAWDTPDLEVRPFALWLALLVVFGAVYLFLDQKRWSPHLVYKRRLATAFALQRLGAAPPDPDDETSIRSGDCQEMPYRVSTTLSSWSKRLAGQPKLLVCCTVHSSSPALDPRRRVWSWVMTDDYVGGPDVGWMRTIDFEAALGKQNATDGTLLAGVAISGAALASSLGTLSKGTTNAALAVVNARLGVWLPNPRYVHDLRTQTVDNPTEWVRLRRLGYLFKEVLSQYDLHDRFVYVSDGGHLDNLGLIELLARRCEHVVIGDASGDRYVPDHPLTPATTFVQSCQLASIRLGVRWETLDGTPLPVDIGHADPARHAATEAAWGPVLAPIAPSATWGPAKLRVAADCAVAVRCVYPDLGDGGPPSCAVMLAKGLLTAAFLDEGAASPERRELVRRVHVAATKYRRFPNDSTADQWLEADQFDGYVALGRLVAERACEVLDELRHGGSGEPAAAGGQLVP